MLKVMKVLMHHALLTIFVMHVPLKVLPILQPLVIHGPVVVMHGPTSVSVPMSLPMISLIAFLMSLLMAFLMKFSMLIHMLVLMEDMLNTLNTHQSELYC